MSFINESRNPLGLGFLPLQHQNFQRDSIALDMRASIMGLRIKKRFVDGPDGLGEYQYDQYTVGDIIGASLWVPQPGAGGGQESESGEGEQRLIPAWRFSWPVVGIGDPGTAVGGPGGGQTVPIPGPGGGDQTFTPCPKLPSDIWARPALRADNTLGVWQVDNRFQRKTFPRSIGGFDGAPYPKLAQGMEALVFAGTDEREQRELLTITDPRLLAVNNRSDRDLGTLVCDTYLNQFSLDPDRCARLQSIFRVVRLKKSASPPDLYTKTIPDIITSTIAIQLEYSGCHDDIGGLVFKERAPSFLVTETQDPNPPRSPILAALDDDYGGFLHVGALFDKHQVGKDMDGHPINAAHIDIEAQYFSENFLYDGPFHFEGTRFNAKRGPFNYEVEMVWDGSSQYRFGNVPMAGRYRWQAYIDLGDTAGFPTGDDGFSLHRGQDDGDDTFDFPRGGRDDIPFAPPRALLVQHREGLQRHFTMTMGEISHPSMLFRPQFFAETRLDFRNLRGIQSQDISTHLRTTPIVARLDSYGRQGNSDWGYTSAPGAPGRYSPFPTASGGLVLLPAEISLEQLRDKMVLPASLSRAHLAIPPYARLAFGLPSTTSGAVQTDSILFMCDEVPSPVGVLLKRMNSDGTLSQVGRFDPTGWGIGSAFDAAGSKGGLFMTNAETNPTGTPVGGGLIYVKASDQSLHFRSSDGSDIALGAPGASSDVKVAVFEGGTQVGTVGRRLDFTNNDFNVTEDGANDQFDIAINRNAVNGIPGLDGSGLIGTAQEGTGAASANTYLQGDRTWSGILDPSTRLHFPRKTDPGSPSIGEAWINGKLLKYRDNQGSPATQTVEILSNKGIASGYASLDVSTLVPTAQQGTGVADATKYLRGDRTWQVLGDVNSRLEIDSNTLLVGTRRALNFTDNKWIGWLPTDVSSPDRVDIEAYTICYSLSVPFTDGDTVRRVTLTDASIITGSRLGFCIVRPNQASGLSDKGYIYNANQVNLDGTAHTADFLIQCLDWLGEDPWEDPPNETITLLYWFM